MDFPSKTDSGSTFNTQIVLSYICTLFFKYLANKIPKVWRQSRIIVILKPVGSRLTNEQVGFRPGKSCTSQLLHLTQQIEDGYQNRMNIGAAFVDLSAAYDTVNHRIMVHKIFNTTRDGPLCRAIQNMLSSRRLYVELNNERSRWRKQKKCSITSIF